MTTKYGVLKYSSNNSGGDWWLTDEDWYAMEKAGWNVIWFKDDEYWTDYLTDGRWLRALASDAEIEVDSLEDAKQKIRDWEKVTGATATDMGCPCCGRPHNFSITTTDGKHIHPWTDYWY